MNAQGMVDRETRLEDVNVTIKREAYRDVVIIHCRPDPDLSSIRGNFESVYLTFRECAAATVDAKSEQGQSIEGDKV